MNFFLGLVSAVMRSRIPSVIYSASAITTGIAACASMDFPLAEASYHPNRMFLSDFSGVIPLVI